MSRVGRRRRGGKHPPYVAHGVLLDCGNSAPPFLRQGVPPDRGSGGVAIVGGSAGERLRVGRRGPPGASDRPPAPVGSHPGEPRWAPAGLQGASYPVPAAESSAAASRTPAPPAPP